MKPPALRPGDTIGVIAPGSAVPPDRLEAGVARLESLGYRVRYRPDILATEGTFAGSHARRAAEFQEMLDDPEIRAVFCARGGYGCNYLVHSLTLPLDQPKIVMGYSDVTTLHTFLWKQANWVTFHGPMVSIDFAQSLDALGPALTSTGPWEARRGLQVLSQGTAEGTLLGGCLSILVTTLGTAREIDWRGAIVLLEDLGEAPYRIDRMIFQLREAGKFDGVRGVVLGEMKDCGKLDWTSLTDMGIPVVSGFPTGHTAGENVCLPLGVQARIEDDRLTILEGAVS